MSNLWSLRCSEILTLLACIIILNALVILAFNPLVLGLIIIAQALLVALFNSIFFPSFWFSYMLILIYLGGLLVLFIYVSSLASNEQINSSFKPLPLILILAFIIFYTYPSFFPISAISNDNLAWNQTFTWIFSPSFLIIAGTLIVYLFIALVAVVKITKWWGGSLRPKRPY